LGYKNKCAFISVYIIPEKKGESDEKSSEEKQEKYPFARKFIVIG
jgi:hypothetical protein